MADPIPSNRDDQFLAEIQNSMKATQQQMQDAYADLAQLKLTGKSSDLSVLITMSGTYEFEEIDFKEDALKGGVKEFKGRIADAWRDLCDNIQKTTQGKTAELLQGMPIPEEIKNLTLPGKEDNTNDLFGDMGAEFSSLMAGIKDSILDMQRRMQETYSDLSSTNLTGESHDKTVRITMTAAYGFVDIDFDERALQGGVKEFKWRIREAWKTLNETVQKTTQQRTFELLQTMQMPSALQQMAERDGDGDGDGGNSGTSGGRAGLPNANPVGK